MIELQDVTLKIRKRHVLNGISLKLGQGSFVGLVGENGSGKTSLLKVMAGLLKPTAGTALLSGQPITRRVASEISYMADADGFFSFFTAQELFDFYATQFKDFDLKKAVEISGFLQVPLKTKLKDLSKGSRGRAKIAATLARDTGYYLLDEPFSGLDPMVRMDIAKGLIRFTDPARQTIIMTTHEISEIEPLLDRIVVLKEGRIIAENSVDGIRYEHGMDATKWVISLFEEQKSEFRGGAR